MMAEAPSTWSIIINWRRPEETCACLEALLRGVDARTVLVIDNGSGDDSVRLIQQRFPRVWLLPLAHNVGFARAANIGGALALRRGAAAVFLLNNDALVSETTVAALTDYLLADERRGVLSAKVLLAHAPQQFWAVGGLFRGRRVISLGAGEDDHGQYDTAELDYVYGCAMLLRASLLRELGGFDERFFMYYEDVDLCVRARAAGYMVGLAPHVMVRHLGSRSTEGMPALKIFYEARSRMLFFAKHLPRRQQPRFYLDEVRYVVALVWRRLRVGDVAAAVAHVRGRLAALSRASWRSEQPR